MADVIVIGCVASKQSRAAEARDLYTSTLFKKRRAYAEASGKPWFVLSALHGLVPPEKRIDPYDFTMAGHSGYMRRLWALRVALGLALMVGSDCNQLVEVHAGAAYTAPLRQPLAVAGFTMLTPVKGMMIGRQLAWYGRGE